MRDPTASHQLRVLIVDDHDDTRETLSLILRLDGFEVFEAANAAKAMAFASVHNPDAMIVDLFMPETDGFALAAQVRATTWGSATRLVALTGMATSEHIERARLSGFDAYFLKPQSVEELCRYLMRGKRTTENLTWDVVGLPTSGITAPTPIAFMGDRAGSADRTPWSHG